MSKGRPAGIKCELEVASTPSLPVSKYAFTEQITVIIRVPAGISILEELAEVMLA
jgi:hypothetical protein